MGWAAKELGITEVHDWNNVSKQQLNTLGLLVIKFTFCTKFLVSCIEIRKYAKFVHVLFSRFQ